MAVRHEGYLKSGGYRSTAATNQAIIVAVPGILVISGHVLATGTPYRELDVGYFDRRCAGNPNEKPAV